MDAVLLSRIQTGITIGVHYIFPGLTLGMALFILLAESFLLKTGKALYRDISAFTVKILALVFAFGVGTGLILPFSFGTNWAEFSKATGPVFGTNLAVEGIVAFTLEAVFIGVLLFGRKRISPRAYWLSAFLVFLGSHVSALVIVATNSWMQTPFHDAATACLANPVPDALRDGFYVADNGRFVLTNFLKVFFNPSTVMRTVHTVTAAWVTGSMFMMGVAAWYLLKNRDTEKARAMFRMAAAVALINAVLLLGVGHLHVLQVRAYQPAAGAAMEGHFKTTTQAPLYILGWVDTPNRTTHGLYAPWALSILGGGTPDYEVEGLDKIPESEWPPIQLPFQAFRLMLVIGGLLMAISAWAVWAAWWVGLEGRRWLLRACLLAIPLPIIANEAGWMLAEAARQPWVVWKLLTTTHAASQVPADYVLFSLIVLSLVLATLLVLFVRAISHIVKKGIQ